MGPPCGGLGSLTTARCLSPQALCGWVSRFVPKGSRRGAPWRPIRDQDRAWPKPVDLDRPHIT